MTVTVLFLGPDLLAQDHLLRHETGPGPARAIEKERTQWVVTYGGLYYDPIASLGGSIIVRLWSLDHAYTAHPSCIVHREGLVILDETSYCGPVRYFYGPPADYSRRAKCYAGYLCYAYMKYNEEYKKGC